VKFYVRSHLAQLGGPLLGSRPSRVGLGGRFLPGPGGLLLGSRPSRVGLGERFLPDHGRLIVGIRENPVRQPDRVLNRGGARWPGPLTFRELEYT
jgi:hypothetical protein